MLIRHYSKTGRFCRVTFKISAIDGADKVALCGDFNEWDAGAHPMRPLKNGGFSVTVSLPVKQYQFLYCIDGRRWENEPDADDIADNPFGGKNSVIRL